MTNAEQFLEHYIVIEKMLRKTYGSKSHHETFLHLVAKAEKKSSLIRHYANDLREYGELRNAIVHNRTPNSSEIIAEPHSFVVATMAKIRQNIEKPLKIKDVMTRPVFTATIDDNITATARLMYQKLYTHVPIYNGSKFEGVLSESALLKWVGELSEGNRPLDAKRTILEMVHQLDQPGNKFNNYEFASRNMFVLDVKNRFEQAMDEGIRLGAIFITKTGKMTELIDGMVTAWDLPKLTLK